MKLEMLPSLNARFLISFEAIALVSTCVIRVYCDCIIGMIDVGKGTVMSSVTIRSHMEIEMSHDVFVSVICDVIMFFVAMNERRFHTFDTTMKHINH